MQLHLPNVLVILLSMQLQLSITLDCFLFLLFSDSSLMALDPRVSVSFSGMAPVRLVDFNGPNYFGLASAKFGIR